MAKIIRPTLMMALPVESQGLFEGKNIAVAYSGVGKVNAAMKATELILNGAKVILNMGSAGSPKFKTHELVECISFVQRDMDLTPLGFEFGDTPFDEHGSIIQSESRYLSHLSGGVCGTGDSFATGESRVPCELFDMEAYAIAKVCKKFQVPFVSVKFISDGADHAAHLDWHQNLLKGAHLLLQTYKELTD